MLTHVVLFTMQPNAEAGATDRLVHDALQKLTQIPGVQHLSAGRVLQEDSEYQIALSMQFADVAALEAYRVHPVHTEYVAYLSSVTTGRRAYDFED